MLLLFFAYLYGVIHALGPGHGKTLVASYFLSNERSYTKAFGVSVAIGVVHTFSAFLLTLVVYYVVSTFLAQFMNDTIFYTTKISALIIIGIAIYLLVKKYKAYKELERQKLQPAMRFSTMPHIETCACATCKVDKNSTDFALIVSAGIIPCPGTTTLFIFAISLGLFYAGFISALVMSMGMSSVIFISAVLSVFMRKKAIHTNEKLKKYLEYASLIVILALGIFLLLA
jgi:ABC-type nickel/cobalt efflux system permease component RcnA